MGNPSLQLGTIVKSGGAVRAKHRVCIYDLRTIPEVLFGGKLASPCNYLYKRVTGQKVDELVGEPVSETCCRSLITTGVWTHQQFPMSDISATAAADVDDRVRILPFLERLSRAAAFEAQMMPCVMEVTLMYMKGKRNKSQPYTQTRPLGLGMSIAPHVATAAERDQVLGHSRADIFERYYISQKVKRDVESAYLGCPARESGHPCCGNDELDRGPKGGFLTNRRLHLATSKDAETCERLPRMLVFHVLLIQSVQRICGTSPNSKIMSLRYTGSIFELYRTASAVSGLLVKPNFILHFSFHHDIPSQAVRQGQLLHVYSPGIGSGHGEQGLNFWTGASRPALRRE
ncbi:uncharacterized protein PADG_04860 [Paracoccidioides brasiliensis Pb18]|uniref:Uncharacterized protein n=1 Tax=Paracoccidioides brasiliensis (strain Pb18) TaxID=502780 RepID=C1GB59_PARBD|nr:uncharacterized protein PADG_04860 [Paracoccidioides brasiliensis Pb18]EEH48781.2 hypothetical protein PADG_04860 [Paracoccidioides brasiliensis Pb18]